MMALGDWLSTALIAAYLGIGLAYACAGRWPMVAYYVGATILTAAVLYMAVAKGNL